MFFILIAEKKFCCWNEDFPLGKAIFTHSCSFIYIQNLGQLINQIFRSDFPNTFFRFFFPSCCFALNNHINKAKAKPHKTSALTSSAAEMCGKKAFPAGLDRQMNAWIFYTNDNPFSIEWFSKMLALFTSWSDNLFLYSFIVFRRHNWH